MADSSNTNGPLDRLEDALVRLTNQQLAMTQKIDEFLSRVSPILSSPSTSPPPFPPPHYVHASTHKMKLEIPRFNGTNPLGWIFKINQYFEYHGTPEYDRLTIAAFYMEDRALAWFQWRTSNDQFTSWPIFLQVLQARFAPSQYEGLTGSLFKLMQKGIVSQYLSEFEKLMNRVIGLPPSFLLSCFVSGLSPDIRREVQIHQPLTVAQVSGLACLQEEKLLDHWPPPPRPQPPPSTIPPPHNPSLPPLLPSPPRPPPQQPPPTLKRLSPEEIALRRERGLCFTCDEKYHRGHRYAFRVFLLIEEDEDPANPVLPFINPPDPTPV